MSNICDFDRILKTEWNLQHFTRNCRIKNLDDFKRDEADACFWENRTFKCKGERNNHIPHYEQVVTFLVMFLRGGEVNVVQH